MADNCKADDLEETKPSVSKDENDQKHATASPWRYEMTIGSTVDCKDGEGVWIPAEIKEVKEQEVYIHYMHWDETWDEWKGIFSPSLAKFGSHRLEYRYQAGFQKSHKFDTSPYSHLSKNQPPLHKATVRSSRGQNPYRGRSNRQDEGDEEEIITRVHDSTKVARAKEEKDELQKAIVASERANETEATKGYLKTVFKSEVERQIKELEASLEGYGSDDEMKIDPSPHSKLKQLKKDLAMLTSGKHVDNEIDVYLPRDFDQEILEEVKPVIGTSLWCLQYAIQRDFAEDAKQMIIGDFPDNKRVKQKALEWATEYQSSDVLKMMLTKMYPPLPINLQATPLLHAVHTQNPDICMMILNEMLQRTKSTGERYQLYHVFKEIIRKDMAELAEDIIMNRLYRPTDEDFELARKLENSVWDFLSARYCLTDNTVMDDDDDDDDDDELNEDYYDYDGGYENALKIA